jgi:hypothetical protein
MTNANPPAPATPSAKPKSGGAARLTIAEYGPKGEVRSSIELDDPARAMRKFAELVDAKPAQSREPGSYVSITDDQLKFGGALMSEGMGVTSLRFEKPEGQNLYQSTRDDMKRGRDPVEQRSAAPNSRIEAIDDKGPTRRTVPPLEESFNVTKTGLAAREYRFRDQGERVAFSEKMFSIEAPSVNQPAIKAMMDRAAERGWDKVHLHGSLEFQRQAWIAAEARSIKAMGYEPTEADRLAAAEERGRLTTATPARSDTAAQARDSSPERQATPPELATPADPTTRKLRQLTTLIDSALQKQQVSPEIRQEVRQLMISEAARRVLRGDRFSIKVFDPAAARTASVAGMERSLRSREPDRSR